MGSGFLRDIALRKQLEEKVREAAKTRQMAEEETNAAKALIEGVKKIGGDVSDAEGALADATAAMGSKDYKVALERASEAKERAKRAYGDRARHFLDTTRNLMTVTRGLGVDVRDGLQALDKADEAYAREAYEDAVELAQKAWKKIEKGLHEHLSSSFSTAQSLILTAKGIGKNTSSAEDLLSRARSAVESNDYEQAISFTQECLDTVTAELREEVDRAAQGARAAVQSAQELGMDPGAAVRHLDRAQSDMEHGQYDKALNALKQARTEAEKALGKSLESRASDFLRMIEEAEKIGAEVGPARNLLRAFENAMRDGNLAEATNLAKEGYKVLQKAQFDRVVLTISASRDKFMTARNIGADLTPAIEGLNRARLALQAGKFQEALTASRQADETLDQIVREFRSIEAEIRVLYEAVGEAERLGVDVSTPKRSLDHVRSALAQQDFRTATENLRRGREELEQARTDRAMQAIEKAEHLLATGEMMGARLDEASAVLEEAVGAGRARNFEKAAELAVQSRELTEKVVHTALGEMVAGLKGGMQYLGEDAPSVRTLLERAESTLSARDFDAAYGYVEEARRLAEGRTKDRAVQFHELLRSAVQLGIQVGVDVHSLEALLHEANAEVDRGRYAEVVALKEKAMRDLAVAAENAFNQVKAKVVEAKNLHIDIAEMRDMLKRAKVALGVEDYAQAFQLLSGCNEKASKILSMHKEVYNAISSAAALVAEAKKRDVNVSKVLDMLLEAKRAHERFDSEKALELAQRAKAETEKLMVLYTSAQKIMAARELLAVMARAGIEAPHLKQLLDDAKEAIKNKEYQAALEHSERGEREVHELMHERTASVISAAESLIASLDGISLLAQEEKLIKARETLERGEFVAALQVATTVRGEIEAIKKESEEASVAVGRARDLLAEIEAVNVESPEGAKLLEQAMQANGANKFDEAIALAQKAITRIDKDREEQVAAMMKRFEEAIQRAKRDKVDTRSAERLLGRAKEFLKEKKYRQALALAMQSEGEAEKVGLQQDMATKAIATADKRLRGSNVPMPDLEKMLGEAKRALEEADYVRALDMAIKTGEEFNHRREAHEEAFEVGRRAQRLRDAATTIGLDTEAIDDFLVQAQEKVQAGDFEAARNLYQKALDASLSTVQSGVAASLEQARELADTGRLLALDMAVPYRKVSEAKALVAAEDFEGAARLIREGTDLARETIHKVAEEAVATAGSNIEHAQKVGADVQRAEALLAQAREALAAGAYGAVMARAKESHSVVHVPGDAERRFVERSSQAEGMIRRARKFGIEVREAERLLEEAIRGKREHPDRALELADEAHRLADQAIEEFSPRISAALDVKEAVAGEWSEAVLTLTNDAKALAKDVKVSILGDAEVEGLKELTAIRAKGTATMALRVRPNTQGSLPLAIKIKSARILDGKTHEAEVIASVEVGKPASPEPKLRASAESRCPVCKGLIKVGFTIRQCPHCSKDMHELCFTRTTQCPACGQSFGEAPKRKTISSRVG